MVTTHYKRLHQKLEALYSTPCHLSQDLHGWDLSGLRDEIQRLEKQFIRASKEVHQAGQMTPQMLKYKPIKRLTACIAETLGKGLDTIEIAPTVRQNFRDDVYVFSGLKAFHALKEASTLLKDENGKLKDWKDFKKDILKVNEKYNTRHLQAEYNHAKSVMQNAEDYERFQANKAHNNLRYIAVMDGLTRPAHADMHDTIRPVDDDFWAMNMPPNGWNCRCRVLEVPKSFRDETPYDEAIERSRKAMQGDPMFRGNPYKDGAVFPKNHPYYGESPNGKSAQRLSRILQEQATEKAEKVTDGWTIYETERGAIRIHSRHGKNERKENLEIAKVLANKHGYEIDLLPKSDRAISCDAYNKTLHRYEEYKTNLTPTITSIDNLLRKGAKQAPNIVLRVMSDIPLGMIQDAIKDRVNRSTIETITLLIGYKTRTYTRDEILKDGFIIQQGDLK